LLRSVSVGESDEEDGRFPLAGSRPESRNPRRPHCQPRERNRMARPVNLENELDVIEELQLRRWARENYVPPELRPPTQHPVVRNEMQLRDEERIIESRARESVVAYVPLVPTVIQRLHEPHDLPERPAVLRHESITAVESTWLC
jgi:hypothetical protein